MEVFFIKKNRISHSYRLLPDFIEHSRFETASVTPLINDSDIAIVTATTTSLLK